MERERREEDYSNIKSLVGFHPLSFVDDVINSTNDYCCDSVEELANFLRGHKTIGKKYKQEIEQVCVQTSMRACITQSAGLERPVTTAARRFCPESGQI